MTFRGVTRSPDETRAVAAAIAEILRIGDVVALHGDLGAGKTTFVQGAAAALGVEDPVTSPTFTIVAEHPGPVPVAHVDAYRIATTAELDELGLEETFEDRITFVEWPERLGPVLPRTRLDVRLELGADSDHRRLVVAVVGPDGLALDATPEARARDDLAHRAAPLATTVARALDAARERR